MNTNELSPEGRGRLRTRLVNDLTELAWRTRRVEKNLPALEIEPEESRDYERVMALVQQAGDLLVSACDRAVAMSLNFGLEHLPASGERF